MVEARSVCASPAIVKVMDLVPAAEICVVVK